MNNIGRTKQDSAHQPTRTKKGIANNNASNNNPVSRKQSFDAPSSRPGFFSFLKNRKRDASELIAAAPDTNSASGSKNNLIHDQHHHHAHLRNDMVPERYPFSHGHGAQRKSGVPGRNGEEPETDMFNFVNIMMDMPDEPTWRQVLVKMAKVLAVMTISYLALMSLYFAAEFQSDAHMENFNVMVVDLDQGMIGFNFLNFTKQTNEEPGQLNWSIQDAKLYPNTSIIQDQIINGYFWGAVVIQPNASSNLYKSFVDKTVDYDPNKAFAFIYDGGRDPLVVKPYIVANMYTQFLFFTKYFNPAWIKFLLQISQQNNVNVTALQVAPQVLGTPVAFEEFDLHPSTASIITSATTVAYIWIFLIAGGSTYLVAHLVQPKTRNASVLKTMAILLIPLLMFLITLSMAYSVLLLAFGVPFPSGGSQFMSLFAGMLLLQCAVASMVLFLIYLIPVVFIPSFTITFVVMNVIAVFNPVELMPKFYRWVYAMPFLNAVQISRFVLMGSYNRLKYNIPILAAWVLIPVVLLPFAISRQKRLAKEVQIEEEEEEERQAEELRLRLQKQHQLKELQRIDRVEDEEGTLSSLVRGERHVVEDAFGEYMTDKEEDIGSNGSENERRNHPTHAHAQVYSLPAFSQRGGVSDSSPSAPPESKVFGHSNQGR
ncbi:hypothetical protein BGZ58_007957 [Dissophora ornata]|nr:hypothetical protein BGZ58_007957 [Dissophora ornata]